MAISQRAPSETAITPQTSRKSSLEDENDNCPDNEVAMEKDNIPENELTVKSSSHSSMKSSAAAELAELESTSTENVFNAIPNTQPIDGGENVKPLIIQNDAVTEKLESHVHWACEDEKEVSPEGPLLTSVISPEVVTSPSFSLASASSGVDREIIRQTYDKYHSLTPFKTPQPSSHSINQAVLEVEEPKRVVLEPIVRSPSPCPLNRSPLPPSNHNMNQFLPDAGDALIPNKSFVMRSLSPSRTMFIRQPHQPAADKVPPSLTVSQMKLNSPSRGKLGVLDVTERGLDSASRRLVVTPSMLLPTRERSFDNRRELSMHNNLRVSSRDGKKELLKVDSNVLTHGLSCEHIQEDLIHIEVVQNTSVVAYTDQTGHTDKTTHTAPADHDSSGGTALEKSVDILGNNVAVDIVKEDTDEAELEEIEVTLPAVTRDAVSVASGVLMSENSSSQSIEVVSSPVADSSTNEDTIDVSKKISESTLAQENSTVKSAIDSDTVHTKAASSASVVESSLNVDKVASATVDEVAHQDVTSVHYEDQKIEVAGSDENTTEPPQENKSDTVDENSLVTEPVGTDTETTVTSQPEELENAIQDAVISNNSTLDNVETPSSSSTHSMEASHSKTSVEMAVGESTSDASLCINTPISTSTSSRQLDTPQKADHAPEGNLSRNDLGLPKERRSHLSSKSSGRLSQVPSIPSILRFDPASVPDFTDGLNLDLDLDEEIVEVLAGRGYYHLDDDCLLSIDIEDIRDDC